MKDFYSRIRKVRQFEAPLAGIAVAAVLMSLVPTRAQEQVPSASQLEAEAVAETTAAPVKKAPATLGADAPGKEKKVCRKADATGSRLSSKRICRKPSEWLEQDEAYRATMRAGEQMAR